MSARRRGSVVVAALSIGFGAIMASPVVAATSTAKPKALGRMVVGVGTDPSELDPAGNMINFAALSMRTAIYDGLFAAQSGNEPVPALALSLVEATDRMSWTLKLRPGVTFHDGSPFDGDAVKFNLDRQQKSQIQGPRASVIGTIEVVDRLTVRLRLEKPYVAMRHLLSDETNVGLMVSPKAVKSKATGFGREPSGGGTGPYMFKEWTAGNHLTVVRNPRYWGTPKPRLDEIVFRIIPDEAAQLNALRAGDISAMSAGLASTATRAKGAGLAVSEPAFTGYVIVLMNNTKPPFADVRMRRAVQFAIDAAALAKVVDDPFYNKRGYGLWPKGNPWYVAPTESLEYNVAAAKKLVAEYEKEKGPVKIEFVLPSAVQTLVDGARLIVANLGAVGIDAKLVVQPDANQVVVSLLFGLYDMAGFVAGLSNDPDLTAFAPLHSSSLVNFSKYKNPEMDAALETGRTNADLAARRQAYTKVQQLMRRDIPFFVSSPSSVRLISAKTVCGLRADADFFPAKTAGFTC